MQYKVQEPEFLDGARQSYITRRIPRKTIYTLLRETAVPESGDLVLVRVQWLGQIDVLEDHRGHRIPLRQDDLLILAYGNHQDLEQYDAVLPARLGSADLVTAAGLIASIKCWHHTLSYPTRLEPLGLLGDEHGRRLNLLRFGLENHPVQRNATCYATVGARTATLEAMVASLAQRRQRVGVLQITGTGSADHREALHMQGAEWVVDFSDAGFASTYLLLSHELLGIFISLIHHLDRQGATTIVVEIAGSLRQRESRLLIGSPLFRASIDGMLIAKEDGRYQRSETDRDQPLPERQLSHDPGALLAPQAISGLFR